MKATVMCRNNALKSTDKEKVLISIGSYDYNYNFVPKLDDWYDMLVLAFDDILPEKIEVDRRILDVPMNMDQAEEIHNFIVKHLGREFIIHCDAGISRSAAVGSYMEKYYEYDVEYYEIGHARDMYKNAHVFNLLGRLNYHSAFGDIDD